MFERVVEIEDVRERFVERRAELVRVHFRCGSSSVTDKMQKHWKAKGNSNLSFLEASLKVAEIGKQVTQFDGGSSGENAFENSQLV